MTAHRFTAGREAENRRYGTLHDTHDRSKRRVFGYDGALFMLGAVFGGALVGWLL